MKRLLLFFAALLCVANSFAYQKRDMLTSDATLEHIKPLLVMNQEWVKFPDYADRKGWDAFLGEFKDDYIKAGERALNYEWQHIKATDYLEYERSGSREIMQRPNSQNQGALSSLFMAEMAEGEGRFMDQLINGVFFYCEKSSWVLSAHLNAQPGGGALPNYKENYIDLGSGEVGAALAWIYYFLSPEFDKVSPSISPFLRNELQVKILDSYLESDYFWWLAADYEEGDMVNNWNPWCNSNCLQVFMLLEQDRDVLAKAVYKSMVSVDKFINYTKEDGACEEGPSYWGHAAGKMYDYLEMLSEITGGEVSIFDKPMIKAMGEYIANSYVGDGWVVNFADASAKGGGDAPLIFRYGSAVGSQQMMSYAKSIAGESKAPSAGSLFRAFETLKYKEKLEAYDTPYKPLPAVWYPDTEFCYMTNKAGMFLATKGGYNNESHNHNDAGTFSLYVDNTPVLIDAGVGTYTRFTFSAHRYDIWTMQSNYHNLPLINGYAQVFGAKYKANNTTFNSRKNSFSVDIAAAYPAEAGIKSWVRAYTLAPAALKISDTFSLESADKANQINFLTWGDVDITTPGVVKVKVGQTGAKLSYDAKLFDTVIETVELPDPRLSNVWGKQIYRVSLNAKECVKSGTYDFVVTKGDF